VFFAGPPPPPPPPQSASSPPPPIQQHEQQQQHHQHHQQKQLHGHHAAAKRLLHGLQPADYACNDHRCCAERRLIAACVAEARRRGLPPHKVPGYVRRRLGGGVAVVRLRCDGSPGCSAPCTLCARELARYDLKVCCRLDDGVVWCGRLTDPDAPPAKMTSGQRSGLKEWQGRPRVPQGDDVPAPSATRQQQCQRQRQQQQRRQQPQAG
jgi:hypothetical protein